MGKLRILIGDDHTLMRQGLRKILEERPDWEIIAEAGDGRSAVRETLALQPDVAVLDIGMPLLNGIEATAQITRKLPAVARCSRQRSALAGCPGASAVARVMRPVCSTMRISRPPPGAWVTRTGRL